jgi:hypothetical protein
MKAFGAFGGVIAEHLLAKLQPFFSQVPSVHCVSPVGTRAAAGLPRHLPVATKTTRLHDDYQEQTPGSAGPHARA